MKKLKHINGDIFNYATDVILHGVNASNGYGSGVAGQIGNKFPKAKKLYHDKYLAEGWELGDVQFCYISPYTLERVKQIKENTICFTPKAYNGLHPLFIANGCTQKFYGRSGFHINYEALRKCLKDTFDFCQTFSYSISMPRIGSGLAGGDPSYIEKIVGEVLQDYDVDCTMFTLTDQSARR